MDTRRKIFLLFAGLPGLVLISLVILYFSAARIINSESVKDKVRSFIIEKAGADIRYGSSEFHLFPLPEIVFHQVDVAISDKSAGSVASLKAYPGLLSLIRGRTEISKIGLEAPHFTVRMSGTAEKPSLEEIEEKVRSAIRVIVSRMPGVQIAVRSGRLDIVMEDGSAFSFDMIRSQLSASGSTVDMELTGRSNISDDISVSLSVGVDDLKSKGAVRLAHLRPDMIIAHLSEGLATHLKISDSDISVKFSTTGLREVNASLESSLSGLTVLRGEKKAALGDAAIKGDFTITPDMAAVHIKEATISHPKLIVSGQYVYDRNSGMITADLKGESISVQPLRESALALGEDISLVKDIFTYVQGGKIPALHFHAGGKSLAELGQMKSIRISGKMRDGIIHVAAKDLTFKGVDGDVVISGGILEAGNVRASLGDHRVDEGKLRIGLAGKDAPFHLDMQVKAVVEHLPALLKDKQLLTNKAVLREMDRLRDLKGSAGGRLILGDRFDEIHVTVRADKVNVSAHYEPLPFPLAVTGGKIFFDEKTVGVADSEGRIGVSSFSGLTGGLTLADPYDLEIAGGQFSISADEIYPWITSFEKTRQVLKDVRSAKGIISVSSILFQGPLYEPKQWKFRIDGDARKLMLDAAFLPGKAEDMNGNFALTQDELSLKNMRTKIIDSPVMVTGSVREFPSDIRTVTLGLQGEIGPAVAAWLTGLLTLPKEMKIRAPFSVTDGAFSFEKDKKTAFSGRLAFGKGTEVALSVANTPQTTTVRDLTVKDRGNDFAATAEFTRKTIDASFRGTLTSRTLDSIFIDSIFSDASVEGDFKAHIVLGNPRQSTAEGRLKGKNIPLFREQDLPVIVRHISLQARDNAVKIDAAELASGDMIFKARGTFSSMPEWFSIDLDISANRIEWERLKKRLQRREHAPKGEQTGGADDFPIRGTVRLRSDFFQYGQYRWEPFDADVSFSGKTVLVAAKKASLCGISTTGNVSIDDRGVRVDISLSAKGLDFEPTILCLSDRNADITGTFEMDARLKGEGKISDISERLSGVFTFSAKDGNILKAKRLDKTLELLNESENFKGQFPDLGREIINYSSLKMRGSLQERKIQIEEGILDSSVIGLQARGSIDLGSETIDLNAFISPLKTIHQIVRSVPVLAHIPGSGLISIPVKISGDMKDPRITFLSPSAIAAESLNLVERVFKFPVTLVQPIFPAQQNN